MVFPVCTAGFDCNHSDPGTVISGDQWGRSFLAVVISEGFFNLLELFSASPMGLYDCFCVKQRVSGKYNVRRV